MHRLRVLKAYLAYVDETLGALRVGLAKRLELAAAEDDKLERTAFDALMADFETKAASIQAAAREVGR